MSVEKSLEERVSDLEGNIYALNQSLTETATAIKALLVAQQAKGADLQGTIDDLLMRVCPFPPECGGITE
jgi:prefoldin subunit 5